MYLPLGNCIGDVNGVECRDVAVELLRFEWRKEVIGHDDRPPCQEIRMQFCVWLGVWFPKEMENKNRNEKKEEHMPTNDNLCNFRFKLNKNNNNNNNGILNERTKYIKSYCLQLAHYKPPLLPWQAIPTTDKICIEGTTTIFDAVVTVVIVIVLVYIFVWILN